METLKFSDDLIQVNNNRIKSGFDMFILGHSEPKPSEYGDKKEWYDLLQGYNFAMKMAKEDGIAFTKVFKCKEGECYPFQYGGFFVCNNCGGMGVDKDWWKIKVEKDGNEFCCHGLDFVNLQESENFAFGETFELAIKNYGIKILSL